MALTREEVDLQVWQTRMLIYELGTSLIVLILVILWHWEYFLMFWWIIIVVVCRGLAIDIPKISKLEKRLKIK